MIVYLAGQNNFFTLQFLSIILLKYWSWIELHSIKSLHTHHRYDLLLFQSTVDSSPSYKEVSHFLREEAVFTTVRHVDDLMHGMLVKDDDLHKLLREFVHSNRDAINSCYDLFLNNISKSVTYTPQKRSLFSTNNGGMFWPTLISFVGIVGVIIVYGMFHDFCGQCQAGFLET